jgi:hypothetical protein
VTTVAQDAPDQHEGLSALRWLLVATRMWARGHALDHAAVRSAQDQALLWLHRHYVARIPLYRQVALREGLETVTDAGTLAAELMLTSDVFKSYDPDWLAERDFAALTAWLGTVFLREPRIDGAAVGDLAQWRATLRDDGVFLTWSSGTGGQLSFVPRDSATLSALRNNGALYGALGGAAGDAPDCLALTQQGLGLGIQAAARGVVDAAERSHHLDLPAPGAPAPAVEAAWSAAARFLRDSTRDGRPVTVVGTPALAAALCGYLVADGPLRMPAGSLVVTGGGWKAGPPLSADELAAQIEAALAVPPEGVLDVYGAAELNCYLVRCSSGRYHVPPLVRPVALDPSLSPLEGDDVSGLLGFLDPFALSYPGFVVPGDVGRLVFGDCPCGLEGWAVYGAIRRAPQEGARGCATVPPGGPQPWG